MPDFVFRLLGQRMMAIDPTVRTSMWWDLSGGKMTEIDFLNGAVVAASEAMGLQCSANKNLVELVHRAERGELARGMSGRALMVAIAGKNAS
jgi:2-dehydropantoate 2-reductase